MGQLLEIDNRYGVVSLGILVDDDYPIDGADSRHPQGRCVLVRLGLDAQNYAKGRHGEVVLSFVEGR